MAQYSLTLVNYTTNPWHFAIYQEFPDSPERPNIAWQVVSLSEQNPGTSSPSSTVKWTKNYGTVIANYDDTINGYTGIAYANATLGSEYQITSENDIPTINPTPVGSTSEDLIFLTNHTSPAETLNIGFTLDGNILAVETDVGGNEYTILKESDTYYVAAYRDIDLKPGTVIVPVPSLIAGVSSIPVTYENGVFTHTVQIYEYLGKTSLQQIK